MTPILPRRPSMDPGGPASHGLVDPRLDRELHRARWAAQAARWRALELARLAFGAGVELRLEGSPGRPGLQGLLHLDVPFRDLDDHRARESLFLSWVGRDDVLRAVPLLFVFGIGTPATASAGGLPPLPDASFPDPPRTLEDR